MRELMKRHITVGWIVFAFLIAGYLILRFFPLIFGDENPQCSWSQTPLWQAITSIADNVFASLVFAALVYVLRDSIVDAFTRSSRIQSFSGYDEFARSISDALRLVGDRDLHVTMLTPVLFSQKIAEHIASTSPPETKAAVVMIADKFAGLIESTRQSYERVLVGKTSDALINRENAEYIDEKYFKRANLFPPTTGLGYHNNLNETAVFIICAQDPGCRQLPGDEICMVTAIFSSEYKRIAGYTTQNKRLIREALRFYETRFEEAASCNQYVENMKSEHFWPDTAVKNGLTASTFRGNFKKFFATEGQGYQFASDETAE